MYYRTSSFDLEANAERASQILKNECSCTEEARNQDDIFSSLDMTLEFVLAGGPCFQTLTNDETTVKTTRKVDAEWMMLTTGEPKRDGMMMIIL